MKEMSGKSNLHICHFMVQYLEDMNWIKALVENLNCYFKKKRKLQQVHLSVKLWIDFCSELDPNYSFTATKR